MALLMRTALLVLCVHTLGSFAGRAGLYHVMSVQKTTKNMMVISYHTLVAMG